MQLSRAAMVLAVFSVSLSACKKGGSSTQDPTTVVIGATLPLTGAESRIGGFYKEGYDLAFEEVAKAGGLFIGGKRMPAKLVLLDDTTFRP